MLANVPTGSAFVITGVALFHAAVCAPVSAYLGLAFIHAAAGESLKGVALACLLRYVWMGLLWFLPMGVKAVAFVVAPAMVPLMTKGCRAASPSSMAGWAAIRCRWRAAPPAALARCWEQPWAMQSTTRGFASPMRELSCLRW